MSDFINDHVTVTTVDSPPVFKPKFRPYTVTMAHENPKAQPLVWSDIQATSVEDATERVYKQLHYRDMFEWTITKVEEQGG